MMAFTYPPFPLVRRHGPQGYADYPSYRPWLRDEFVFRCVYCLRREQWGRVTAEFAVDHFLPVSRHPDRATDYANLLYSCSTCNCRKGNAETPDPSAVLTQETVDVGETGLLTAHTAEARCVVRALDLNGPEAKVFRELWLDILRLAQESDPELFHRLIGISHHRGTENTEKFNREKKLQPKTKSFKLRQLVLSSATIALDSLFSVPSVPLW